MSEKKLYVVGIGPGEYEQMTIRAAGVLSKSQILIGYTVYIDLIREYFPAKECVSTPMMKEVERCRMALEKADQGHVVSMVCSGDAGIYGMAGLILELAGEYPQVEVEMVAGVTAASAGAALLGAPVCHDFAVISLSDLLTPKEQIEKRLECAAMSDLVICLYNPASRRRKDYLKWACEVVGRYQSPDTVCGMVKNIGREGQAMELMTLRELADAPADMFTTVYIGSSKTTVKNGRMVTPRGYRYV
ncbi:MAG: precorrin-3B C(17)-methyltransferase [Hungatella sp.]|nr:precorrin-3B C(17)-methyltransferase [Hungatella sp.]